MIGTNLRHAADLLKSGKLVAIPTETVYGLAANALNEQAVVNIFKVKNRPFFDPLIVHLHSIDQMDKYATEIPQIAYKLAEKFWPGPLTLVLNKRENIPDIVTAGLDNIGLRMPAHPVCIALLKMLPFPLAAPSANPFGYISPTSAKHVEDQLGEKIDYILDGGHCEIGLESTIVGFDDSGNPIVLRLGGISIEALELMVGEVSLRINQNSDPKAPGQLDAHYAPNTKLIICDNLYAEIPKHQGKNIGVLSLSKVYTPLVYLSVTLSKSANMDEAARNLFKSLRLLDQLKADVILAERVPEYGLGRAINDRLKRAATLRSI
jgi:L-threonylcarbamoyladenylate synthase